eukprot:9484364-Pyramimonas_sp.AAC.1
MGGGGCDPSTLDHTSPSGRREDAGSSASAPTFPPCRAGGPRKPPRKVAMPSRARPVFDRRSSRE